MPQNRSKPWLFWLAVMLLLLLTVPYLFMGEAEPVWLGLPRWFFVTVASTLVITILSIHRIWRSWD